MDLSLDEAILERSAQKEMDSPGLVLNGVGWAIDAHQVSVRAGSNPALLDCALPQLPSYARVAAPAAQGNGRGRLIYGFRRLYILLRRKC